MQLVHKISGCLLALVVLSACATTDGSGPVPDIIVPRPAPITLQQPDTMVVNRTNIDQFVALVQSGKVMVAMTQEEFDKIIENNQQVMVYMSNQNDVIDTYESRITNR